ncbi:metal-dependent hydrolases [Thiohalobacter thiocyanaticus]|uniref:Metal-dependent hydrolases n=1 Tax=Thiohalobacter thiocyanaticus TaxID=585455 RepID=A0A1Z4VT24_9GAMM|nr:Clp1/GlmU family protein [Thiohalobacter thiocyanaticus]BAZ94789.1 metal-dependent hydrolases [Thiohalobacter thiocyanaticus]
MTSATAIPLLPPSAEAVLEAVLAKADRRVLLYGEPGSGKSTLAAGLAAALAARGRDCVCLGADPGSPAFGVPGAVALGQWCGTGWQPVAMEALCSLDAGRFRLPLLAAVGRLLARDTGGTLLIDAPGVVRGVAGAELLLGLLEVTAAEVALCVTHHVSSPPLREELAASGCQPRVVPAVASARRPGRRMRARNRTRQWEAYLAAAGEVSLELERLPVVGTPPPAGAAAAWRGRQLALVDAAQRTLALGEVIGCEDGQLRAQLAMTSGAAAALVIRDAARNARGELETAAPAAAHVAWYRPPPDMLTRSAGPDDGGPRPVATLGTGTAMLVNGIFGDPLLHLRLRHQRRSLLFDLGESERLPVRVVHQVTDVFISHAHADHIMGFLRLLRSRVGVATVCRLYGPPGLHQHIQGMIQGIRWDRIGERGPHFEVHELHDDSRLRRFRLQVGRERVEELDEQCVHDGVLHTESGFRIRAVKLDHGIPVLAYAYETSQLLQVRKDRLLALGVEPGPWLTDLKRRIGEGAVDAAITLPAGRSVRAGELAERLLLSQPGQTLVYATDLADNPANRERLIRLARGAHTFFCEAVFRETEAGQAERTGHLTARACGEIAAAAGVGTLIPFHHSQRYVRAPAALYDEVRAVCPNVVSPHPLRG